MSNSNNKQGVDNMSSTSKDSLTPSKIQELVLKHSYSDIGKLYGVSRQYIHKIYTNYKKEGAIPSDFPESHVIARMKHFDDKLNLHYSVNILSVNENKDKVFITIDDELPRWNKIYKAKNGSHYLKWRSREEGMTKIYKAYVDSFEVLDKDNWVDFSVDYRFVRGVENRNGIKAPYVVYRDSHKNAYQFKVADDVYTISRLDESEYDRCKAFEFGEVLHEGLDYKEAKKELELHVGKVEMPNALEKYIR